MMPTLAALRSRFAAGAELSEQESMALLAARPALTQAAATDADILNFALVPEYLQADFYGNVNASGMVSGIIQENLFQTLEADEVAHVQLITSALNGLGVAPVPKPAIRYPAGTFASLTSILAVAHRFEQTAVSAYLGQLPEISSPTILAMAGAIYGIEARHAALVALLAGLHPTTGLFTGAQEMPTSQSQVLSVIGPYVVQSPDTGFAPA